MKKFRDIYSFTPIQIKRVTENLKSTKLIHRFVTYKPKNFGIVGVEIEVEGVPCKIGSPEDYKPIHAPVPYAWAGKEDGSLRNYGIEYVSVPIRNWELPVALELLAQHLEACPTHDFSPRCGTHFHVNVRDFTDEDLTYFLMYYMIYEKFFFHLAGKERLNSYHCAPLTQVYIREYLLEILGIPQNDDAYAHADKFSGWHKYTSLNLSSIPRFGTLEVRLLPGGYDWNKLCEFVDLILQLRNYIIKTDKKTLREDIINLNSYSNYYTLTLKVFNDLFAALPKLDYHATMRDAVCISKTLCHIIDETNKDKTHAIITITQLKGSYIEEKSVAYQRYLQKCKAFGAVQKPQKPKKVMTTDEMLKAFSTSSSFTIDEYYSNPIDVGTPAGNE